MLNASCTVYSVEADAMAIGLRINHEQLRAYAGGHDGRLPAQLALVPGTVRWKGLDYLYFPVPAWSNVTEETILLASPTVLIDPGMPGLPRKLLVLLGRDGAVAAMEKAACMDLLTFCNTARTNAGAAQIPPSVLEALFE